MFFVVSTMEVPFYPCVWSNSPARPRAAPPAAAKPCLPAKVISIPVHFINSDDTEQRQSAAAGRPSDRVSTSAAALEIQRVFRGFLVRKNLKVVRRLEAEVDAVEREVERAGERLGRDARERLRVSELLMSLLFRLDSVRGVRDYRRRVIRRAITLQEAVDEIAAGGESNEGAASPGNDAVGERSEGNALCETLEAQEPMPMEILRSTDSNLEALEDHGVAPSSRDEGVREKVDEEDSAAECVAEEFKQEEGEGAAAGIMEETVEVPTKEALGEESASKIGSGAVAMGEVSEDHGGDQLGDAMPASMTQDEGGG